MKSLKGKRLGSVWVRVRIEYRVDIRSIKEGWSTPIHLMGMKSTSVLYFWHTLVSIGSLESVTEKLGHGSLTAVKRIP